MLINPCTIPGGEKGSFRDPATATNVQNLVRKILGI
jgi:hypothetical protein